MGVTFLKRTHPERIDADVIRGLRVDGEAPCRDGLREALAWIGDRSLPTDEAVAEAEGAITSDNHSWAMKALCLHGYGYGDGYGYGHGDGYGHGYGYGYGHGYGYGYGHGDGYGHGYGDGDGYGYGDGDGEGAAQ